MEAKECRGFRAFHYLLMRAGLADRPYRGGIYAVIFRQLGRRPLQEEGTMALNANICVEACQGFGQLESGL